MCDMFRPEQEPIQSGEMLNESTTEMNPVCDDANVRKGGCRHDPQISGLRSHSQQEAAILKYFPRFSSPQVNLWHLTRI